MEIHAIPNSVANKIYIVTGFWKWHILQLVTEATDCIAN